MGSSWTSDDTLWEFGARQIDPRPDPREPRYAELVAEAATRLQTVDGVAPAWPEVGAPTIYFVRAMVRHAGGPVFLGIKIGRTENLAQRVRDIRASLCGQRECQLLAFVPGGGELEKALHWKFREHRLFGEWFHPADPLLEYVRWPCAGARPLPIEQEVEALFNVYVALDGRGRDSLMRIAAALLESQPELESPATAPGIGPAE